MKIPDIELDKKKASVSIKEEDPSFSWVNSLSDKTKTAFMFFAYSGAAFIFTSMFFMLVWLVRDTNTIFFSHNPVESLFGMEFTGDPTLVTIPILLVSMAILLVIHELGHAFVAKLRGYSLERIKLTFLFGLFPIFGYVKIEEKQKLSNNHVDNILISSAGIGFQILVTVLLGALVTVGNILDLSVLGGAFLTNHITAILVINLQLAVLNSVPISFVDGGSCYSSGARLVNRVFRSSEDDETVYQTLGAVKGFLVFLGVLVVLL